MTKLLSKKRLVLLAAGLVVAAGLATFAAGYGQRLIEPNQQPPAAAAPSAPSAPGFTEFIQPQPGFALSYPAAWARLPSPDPQVPLLASNRAGFSMQARVLSLQTAIGPAQLDAVQQFTDRVVKSNSSVKVLVGPQKINLGGLPGYFYFYTFTDPSTGQPGAHSHFFLFKGTTMIALVFQAVPADTFQAGSGTFDQITASFRSF
ncbi:MAG TPA: hypothetical protein VGM60_23680 [Pseudonocardia sp.]|uniref:hypothetical protein n=1 Tax=Pseudonocardia sp. TaxID=60912 RepID=UPI002F42D448